jgi:hypothetical protein
MRQVLTKVMTMRDKVIASSLDEYDGFEKTSDPI